jgi:hypothetical protein
MAYNFLKIYLAYNKTFNVKDYHKKSLLYEKEIIDLYKEIYTPIEIFLPKTLW